MAERLQKFLAKSGIGSRRYCEELIKSKKIKVNGQIALIGTTVNRNDEVEYDGNIISFTESEIKLLMLNKPEGVLSSNKKEKTLQPEPPLKFLNVQPQGASGWQHVMMSRRGFQKSSFWGGRERPKNVTFAVRSCLGARMAPRSPQASILEALLINFD